MGILLNDCKKCCCTDACFFCNLSYIWIRYIYNEKCKFSRKDVGLIKRLIDEIADNKNVYAKGVATEFYKMLLKFNMESAINIKVGDIYFDAIRDLDLYRGKPDEWDPLIETL